MERPPSVVAPPPVELRNGLPRRQAQAAAESAKVEVEARSVPGGAVHKRQQ
jgi:hypothetical protein